MPSFDIVSELKKDELQNAVDNANRELQSRYDFRGVEASYTLVKAENLVKLEADEEFQIQQMRLSSRRSRARARSRCNKSCSRKASTRT